MLRQDVKELLKVTPRDLGKFGLSVGGALLGLGLLFYLRHKPWTGWFITMGGVLALGGAILPRALKWIYVAWMTVAMIVGAIVSTMLLVVLFYAVITPIGWIARLAGKDFLRQRIEPNAPSYWIVRPVSKPGPKQDHERQF
jgi:hypothetical protein